MDDITCLRELAERYLYADIGVSMASGMVTLRGIVKAPEDMPDGLPADQVRLRLLLTAERLIDALEPAGWQVIGDITLSFRTEIRDATLDMSGRAVIPSRQEATRLVADLQLLRADSITAAEAFAAGMGMVSEEARQEARRLSAEAAAVLAGETAPEG
jgi:hypothetical protein